MPSSHTPVFIAMEGIDGSGKSTQTAHLVRRMEEAGYPVFRTFEPTDNPIGSMIRRIFNHQMEADQRTIAGLFVADRLHHLLCPDNGMLHHLQQGTSVVTDRYYFSSYAYHGVHTDMEWVIQANAMSARLLRPDINFFIDVRPETSMERLRASRASMEMYETLENLRRVRDKYMEAFERLRGEEHIVIIQGEDAPEQVREAIWTAVQAILSKRKVGT
jgi:dTMP kinase